MLNGNLQLELVAAAPVSFSVSGDVLVIRPTRPIAIVRYGIIATTTIADATNALVLSCDFRPTVGSLISAVTGVTTTISAQTGWNSSSLPAFYTDLAGGTLTLTAASSQLAAGSGAYHNINPQTKMPSTDSSTNPVPSPDTALVAGGGTVMMGLTVFPGQEVALVVQPTAPAAGAGLPFIHYFPLAFAASGNNNEGSAVGTGIPSSIVPVGSDPGIFIRKNA